MSRKKIDVDQLYERYLTLPPQISVVDAAHRLNVCYQTLRNCLDHFGTVHKYKSSGRHRSLTPKASKPKVENKIRSNSYQDLLREVADSIKHKLGGM